MKPEAYIFLIDSNILLIEKGIKAMPHHHHAIKILIQLNSTSIIKHNDKRIVENTLILDADKLHSIEVDENWFIILLLNPESEIGLHIKENILKGKEHLTINTVVKDILGFKLNEIPMVSQQKDKIVEIFESIINSVCGKPRESFIIDQRIKKVLNEIQKLEEKKVSASDLASLAFLSKSRFLHLFKEEIKIPLREYLAWLRLLDALKMLIHGKSLTHAAMDSGFTDLPHLHKTFTHYFGSKISDYFNNSQFIQVFDYSKE